MNDPLFSEFAWRIKQILLFTGVYTLIAGTVFHSESSMELLLREDRLVEVATVLLLLVASFLAFRGWRQTQSAVSLALLGVAGLFALEEISYGATLTSAFSLPAIKGIEMEGLHTLPAAIAASWFWPVTILLGLLLVGGVVSIGYYRSLFSNSWERVYMAMAMLLLGASVLLETIVATSLSQAPLYHPAIFLQETGELVAALALFTAAQVPSAGVADDKDSATPKASIASEEKEELLSSNIDEMR